MNTFVRPQVRPALALTAKLILAVVAFSSACQQLDEAAASGVTMPAQPVMMGPTVALDTPAIELPDGGIASTACDATNRQALEILSANCARCHDGSSPGARQGQPPFDCVLDVNQLTKLTSATVNDPTTMQPARFLIPGDPDHSRLYVRVLNGEMPPPDVVGLPPSQRPTVSDVSVLYEWISHCVGQPAASPVTPAPGMNPASTAAAGHAG